MRLPIISAMLLWTPDLVAAERSTGDWRGTWNWDGLLLFNLGVLWWLYGRGLSQVWKSAGVGRGISRGQAVAFQVGLLAIFVALVSPLAALSDVLASAHMAQHLLLTMVAAPLLVLGAPALAVTWGVPKNWRPSIGAWRRKTTPIRQLLWQPFVVWMIFAITLWVWHLPALYNAALDRPILHDLEHVTMFVAAFLFWRVILEPMTRQRLHPVPAALYLFTASLHAAALGVFLTFAPAAWYDYAATTGDFGFTPLEDQQLAGMLMWMPGCLIFLIAAAALLIAWLDGETQADLAG